jgi:hypothetical protein
MRDIKDMEKDRYIRVWKKIIIWKADDYIIGPDIKDEDFIESVIDGDIGPWTEDENGIRWNDEDWGEDHLELCPGNNYEMSDDKPTVEIWEGGDLLWDNRPQYIKRDEKLKKILKESTHLELSEDIREKKKIK